MTRCRWVDDQKADGFPTSVALGVASSTYYGWRGRVRASPTEAEVDEAYLVDAVRSIQADFDGTYGSPRMTAELRRRGWEVNHKRVERLMADNGIVGVHKRPKVRTTRPAPSAVPLPDLVARDFGPRRPDAAWVGDITYIPTGEGWLYLASVLDLGSRRLLGYSMDERMPTGLVLAALDMAVGKRVGAVEGIIFHSDRRSQYLSADYRARLIPSRRDASRIEVSDASTLSRTDSVSRLLFRIGVVR